MNDSKMLDMTCPNCDGQMEYSEDRQMLICPYCDTKIMLTESDEVKIEKIRSERFEKQREASIDDSKKSKKKRKPTFWLVCTIISFLATIGCITTDSYFAENILLILMTISFAATWICMLNGYLDNKRNWLTVLKVVPWIFFIIFTAVEGKLGEDADVQEYAYYSEEAVEADDMTLIGEDEENYQLTIDDKKRLDQLDSTYVWPSSPVADKMPVADFPNGKLIESTDRVLSFEIYDISQRDYTDYIKECKKAGFTYYEKMKDNSFKADQEDHTSLSITYIADPHTYNSFSVKVELPYKMGPIEWPSNSLMDQLPEPPSLNGKIRVCDEERALILLSDVTQEQFKEYVQACIDAGFGVEDSYDTICTLTFPNSDKHLGLTAKNWDVMQILIIDKE